MPDSLALWPPAGNTALTAADFGAVPAGSSSDVTFRVKNQSTLYTATTVTVAVHNADGSEAVDFYLGYAAGGALTGLLSLGTLPPSAISALLVLRRITRSGAALGAGTCNLVLTAASWN